MHTEKMTMFDSYSINRKILVRFAHKLTGCNAHAEDIVQDTYFRLSTAAQISDSPKAQLSYLFQIVRNLAIDHHRKRTSTDKIMGYDEEDALPDIRTPDKNLQHQQTLSILDDALAELPERTRYAFEQYRIHGVAQKDIAKELNVSNTLVNFMIRDALIHCKQSIERS